MIGDRPAIFRADYNEEHDMLVDEAEEHEGYMSDSSDLTNWTSSTSSSVDEVQLVLEASEEATYEPMLEQSYMLADNLLETERIPDSPESPAESEEEAAAAAAAAAYDEFDSDVDVGDTEATFAPQPDIYGINEHFIPDNVEIFAGVIGSYRPMPPSERLRNEMRQYLLNLPLDFVVDARDLLAYLISLLTYVMPPPMRELSKMLRVLAMVNEFLIDVYSAAD
ncbi:uncharacterized protein LOC117134933 [Drosophila busckii]|uniref:uncharacterized protein LOC117134933 n=1 Tax=Drosophila busckii TaxID=30019 RepID=UPI00143293B2|nr:uncharacterized protein LOC117134933 [Drosophila busckii]